MNKTELIVNNIKGFPPLPAIAAKLMQITGDPESTIDDILKIINIDPSIAVETIKLANSPMYLRRSAVKTIKEALSVLGFTIIRNLAISKAVFNNFRNFNEKSRLYMKKFWEHSFLCGLVAKNLAEDFNENSSDYFIAGLVHDIGKLIIYQILPGDFLKVIKQSERNLFGTYNEEYSITGVTHDKVGSFLLKRWMFPESIISSVGFHHKPGEYKKEGLYPVLINIADTLAHAMDCSDPHDIDQEFVHLLMTDENKKLFKKYDKKWDSEKLKEYIEKLIGIKEENTDTINLFFS